MNLLTLLAVMALVLEGYHVDAQKKGRGACRRKLGGRCIRESKTCPENFPLQTKPGAPYCNKRKLRCCHPVPTAVQCMEKSGFCVENVNRCNGTVEFLYNSKKDKCNCCVPGEKAIISVDEFISKFNKTYENEAETTKRIAIFQDNVEVMKDHNKLYELGESSYQMGVNEYSDLTYDEVIDSLTGIDGNVIRSNENDGLRDWQSDHDRYIPKDIGSEPESMDYRDKGAINPIRNQGRCGSCWAFAAVSSIESQIFLQNGKLVQLSEQYLVDCTIFGCGGGWTDDTILYVRNNGIANSDGYPYTATEGTCNQGAPKTSHKVTGIQHVNPGRDAELLNALVHMGPISVYVYVSPNFGSYRGGVLEDNFCTPNKWINHAVVLVGYGNENGKDYWLIRNSWGESWGEEGYIKLARNVDNHCRISDFGYITQIKDAGSCNGGVIVGKQCLTFSQEKLTWEEAKTSCASKGGVLASILDPVAVSDYAAEKYGNVYFYAGGSDAEVEGTWKWLNGNPISTGQFPWNSGEPNNAGNEDCLVVYGEYGYNDVPCNLEFRYICDLDFCSGGVIIGDQCLVFSQEALNWGQAKTACENRGQTLASLLDPKAVLDYVKEKYGKETFLLGGSDAAKEGEWKWLNGQSIPLDRTEFPWSSGNPNNYLGTQHCLTVNYNGGYDDDSCNVVLRYICEKSE